MADHDLTSWHIPVGSLISWLCVVTVTRPALLFLLGQCVCVPFYPRSLLSSLPALLTFAPQAPQAPLQLPKLLCPAPGMDHSTTVCLRLLERMGSDMRDIIATTIRQMWHFFASLHLPEKPKRNSGLSARAGMPGEQPAGGARWTRRWILPRHSQPLVSRASL